MTGPEHYAKAERHAEASVRAYKSCIDTGEAGDFEAAKWEQAQAQVHATLALAAATAINDNETGMLHSDWNTWVAACSTSQRAEPKGRP